MTASCSPNPAPAPPPAETALDAKIRRFAPVDIAAPVESLPAGEAAAVAELVLAARLMDGLFLEQVWSGNAGVLAALTADRSPEGQAELHYFLINKGPWSRLDHHEVFVRPQFGVPPKPPQANFYPADATKDEVERLDRHAEGPGARRRHRVLHGRFDEAPIGSSSPCPTTSSTRTRSPRPRPTCDEAAALTAQPTLKRFLELRAEAFLSNDYYASDVAWMELDASIEPTIGPYETYEDEWFGYKAAFEAFITLRDDAETEKLDVFGAKLQEHRERAAHRPEAPQREARRSGADPRRQRRLRRRRRQPRRADRGVQPAERRARHPREGLEARDAEERAGGEVREDARADRRRSRCGPDDRKAVRFDAFFTHILMHELMHGLGPHQIT